MGDYPNFNSGRTYNFYDVMALLPQTGQRHESANGVAAAGQ